MLDPPKQRKVLIGTVYPKPSGKVQSAIAILDNNLMALENTEPMAEYVIVGDYNIDLIRKVVRLNVNFWKNLKEIINWSNG